MPQRKPRRKPTSPEIAELLPRNRAAWRRWLEKHHRTAGAVWVVFTKTNLRYLEAVEEALCFGWIDSRFQKLGEDRHRLMFTERRPGGNWARTNKERVARLVQQGRMTPAGMAKVQAAKKDGSWSQLDAVERLEVPDDLARALAEDEQAQANFRAFPPSARKMILAWVLGAKRPETRQRRIAETVRQAAQNLRATP